MKFSKQLTEKAQQLCQAEYGESLTDEQACQALKNLTGFVGLLWEWEQEYQHECRLDKLKEKKNDPESYFKGSS